MVNTIDTAMRGIPSLNTTDMNEALGWHNSAFYGIAAIDAFLIAIGLQGNLSVMTRRHILTKTDDPMIRNVAIADFLLVVFRIIPVFITALYRRWMLGDLLCIITAYLQFIPNMMEMILMATLPLQRLYVMQWPLSSHANSSKRRKLSIRLTAILWAVMIVVGSGLGFRNGRQGVEFAIPRFICQPLWLRTSTTQGMVIRPLVLLLFQVAPLLTTSVANIWVLVICSRTKDPRQPGGSQLKARSIVTILIVTTIFLMSVLPGTILMFVIVFRGGAKDEDPLRNHFVATISMHLSFLNVVVNYYVYKYTGKRVGNGQTRPYPRSRSDMPVIMSNNARNDNPRKSMPMINLAAARNAQLQDKNKNILPKITDLAPESPT